MTALRQSVATFSHGTLFKVGFILLCYLDLLLTLFALQHAFTELNPVMLRFLSRPGELVLAKMIAPPVIAWLVPDRFLLPSIGFLLAVTAWNVSGLVTLA